MSSLQHILDCCPEARPSGEGWQANCPAHDDNVASLSIAEGDDGRVLLHCHAGCSTESICEAFEVTVADLFPDRVKSAPSTLSTSTKPAEPRENVGFRRHDRRPRVFETAEQAIEVLSRGVGMPVAAWSYHSADGNEALRVVRFEAGGHKTFRPISSTEGGWKIGDPAGELPLYRLPEFADDGPVFVAEGEKAAEAVRSLGFVATTSAHGAKSPQKTDWSPLAGRDVIILPDNDDAGGAYAEEVLQLLGRLSPAPQVRIVELPDLPEHGDVVEFVAGQPDATAARSSLLELVQQSEPEVATEPPATPAMFEPFPVHVLPDAISSFVSAASTAIGCDPSFIALPLLTTFAAAIGTTRQIRLKFNWLEPSILWTAIVGDSGTLKTPAFKVAMRPLRQQQERALERFESERKQYEQDLLSYDRNVQRWKKSKTDDSPPNKPEPPAMERFLTSDTTVEALATILLQNPRGVLVSRDELSGWISSFDRYSQSSGGDMAHWLSMHNADQLIVDRKTGIRTIIVPRASVSVTGGIQPGILARSLTTECRESGLAARLLMAWPPRRAKRWTEADLSARQEERLAEIVDRLLNLEPMRRADGSEAPINLRLTDSGKHEWVEFYNAHGQKEADLEGDLASAWSKLEGYAARLALVIHLVRWAADDPTLENSERVDAQSMTAGITLSDWFGREAQRVYAMLNESDEQRAVRRLIDWIECHGRRTTARQLQQGNRAYPTAESAKRALQRLNEQGVGHWVGCPPSHRGGRPTEELVLNGGKRVYETSTKPGSHEVS